MVRVNIRGNYQRRQRRQQETTEGIADQQHQNR